MENAWIEKYLLESPFYSIRSHMLVRRLPMCVCKQFAVDKFICQHQQTCGVTWAVFSQCLCIDTTITRLSYFTDDAICPFVARYTMYLIVNVCVCSLVMFSAFTISDCHFHSLVVFKFVFFVKLMNDVANQLAQCPKYVVQNMHSASMMMEFNWLNRSNRASNFIYSFNCHLVILLRLFRVFGFGSGWTTENTSSNQRWRTRFSVYLCKRISTGWKLSFISLVDLTHHQPHAFVKFVCVQ